MCVSGMCVMSFWFYDITPSAQTIIRLATIYFMITIATLLSLRLRLNRNNHIVIAVSQCGYRRTTQIAFTTSLYQEINAVLVSSLNYQFLT